MQLHRIIFPVLFFEIIFTSLVAQPTHHFPIEHLSIENGLSNESINCILQDSHGFMWIGTSNGLNRYDGQKFKIFVHEPTDSLSLPSSWIMSLFEDYNGELWIGTDNGLCRFNRLKESFDRFIVNPGNPASLNEPRIKDICQTAIDSSALWIAIQVGERATNGGLHRFDLETKEITSFQYNPDDSTTISDNALRFLLEDDDGLLWIGTWAYGVNRFDPSHWQNPSFTRFVNDSENPTGLSHNAVWDGVKDRSGVLWFVTFGGGLNRYDPSTGAFSHYRHQPGNTNSLYSDQIADILIDSFGSIWLCDGMLTRFTPEDSSFVHIAFSENQTTLSNSFAPWTVYEDRSQILWVGTNGSGIFKIDLKPQKFRHYQHDRNDPQSLADNDIRFLFEDKDGFLWIATRNAGLSRFDPKSESFRDFSHNPNDPNTLSANDVRSIIQDSNGNLWIGTTAGLNIRKPGIEYFSRILFKTTQLDGPKTQPWVRSMLEDNAGIIWIGTRAHGLLKYDVKTDTISQFIVNEKAQIETRINDVRFIYEDCSGRLWVDMWHQENLFERETQKLIPITFQDEQGQQLRLGRDYFEDRNENLWGTSNGLNLLDPNTFTIRTYRVHPNPSRDIGFDQMNNKPLCIVEDKIGLLWIGTSMGLHKFDVQTKEFIAHFYKKDGLSSNRVFKILTDNSSRLWALTDRGISILDENRPPGEQIKNLGAAEGIHNSSSSYRAFIKSRNGDIYQGGSNGIFRFFPEVAKNNPHIPQVKLTDFKIFNKSVCLDSAVAETKLLELAYDQNFFTFSFAALDFTNPKQNRYAFKLHGFDEEWIQAEYRTEANYTNVPPGEYLFHVKGSNNDGLWNEKGASVRVSISPPWWHTRWAYAGWLIIALLVIFSLWYFHVRRMKLRNELRLKYFETQRMQELDRLKSRFFANLSHEFRTLLTLISGPLDFLQEYTQEEILRQNLPLRPYEQFKRYVSRENAIKYLRIMKNNTLLLTRLVNQLLDLSNLDKGQLALKTRPTEVVSLLRSFVESFLPYAKNKHINLTYTATLEVLFAYIDHDKFGTIINNLLANALKFTPDSGKVTVTLERLNSALRINDLETDCISISVTDSGIGIAKNELGMIFERFYQTEQNESRKSEGKGIGLSLTKELTELHYGKLNVESLLHHGSTFVVLLPLGKRHLAESEIEMEYIELQDLSRFAQARSAPGEAMTNLSGKPVILIVEDNSDMRLFIRGILGSKHQIIEAGGGNSALDTITDKMPDLIISDIMMPDMDGLELCKKLKEDLRFNHIPLILLTARAEEVDKIRGLDAGADAYVVKPFSEQELAIHVQNILRQRSVLREKIRKDILLEPQNGDAISVDEQFLFKAKKVIKKHLDDCDFSIEVFAKEMALSRFHLNRKLQHITGLSASRFVREFRLRTAAQLLESKAGNVSEIALEVGFDNFAYFNRCFKEKYGCSPSKYKVT